MPPEPETSYQRAMRLAAERKAQQWRAYREMQVRHEDEGRKIKDIFIDYGQRLVPLLIEVKGGTRRSSKQGRVYDHFYMYLRPTEDLAFIKARGEDYRDHLAVIRQEALHPMRYCYGCQTKHPLKDFDFVKRYPQPSGHLRTPPGHRWYCRTWLRKHSRRRAA